VQQITININPYLPKKISPLAQPSKKAFGILKGKIKDPIAWQREILEERQYKEFL